MNADQAARVRALVAKPAVAAIIDRAGWLTDEEKARLHAEWIRHFKIYRTAQGELWNRGVKAYGRDWRDLLLAKRRAVEAERGGLGPFDGEWWGAACAVEDAAAAALFADILSPSEVPVYAGPWLAVIGPAATS